MKGYRIINYIAQCILLISIFVLAHTSPSLAQWQSGSALQLGTQEVDPDLAWNKLNQLAEEALYLTRKKEYLATRNIVTQLENALLQLELGKYVQRLDQANLITETVVQGKYLLNRIEPDPTEVERQMIKIRLMLDAVSHQQQPLWLNFYPKLSKITQDLRYTLEQNQRDSFYQKLNELNNIFELVRPALFVSHKQGVVEQLDSQLAYLSKNKADHWKNKEQTLNVLGSFEKQVKVAFFQQEHPSMQSFIYLIIGISSIICVVLGYVAWRKYKGEQEERTVPWKQTAPKNID